MLPSLRCWQHLRARRRRTFFPTQEIGKLRQKRSSAPSWSFRDLIANDRERSFAIADDIHCGNCAWRAVPYLHLQEGGFTGFNPHPKTNAPDCCGMSAFSRKIVNIILRHKAFCSVVEKKKNKTKNRSWVPRSVTIMVISPERLWRVLVFGLSAVRCPVLSAE